MSSSLRRRHRSATNIKSARAVARLVAAHGPQVGWTNEEIATRLGISVVTAKVATRTAAQQGWIARRYIQATPATAAGRVLVSLQTPTDRHEPKAGERR